MISDRHHEKTMEQLRECGRLSDELMERLAKAESERDRWAARVKLLEARNEAGWRALRGESEGPARDRDDG